MPVPTDIVELGAAPADHPPALPAVLAAGPLLLGVVLSVTTGSPLFLMFGIVSLLGTGVYLLMQHRARVAHARTLSARAHATAQARSGAAIGPAAWALAVRSGARDRFGLRPRTPAGAGTGPVAVHWGTAVGPMALDRDDEGPRWHDAVVVEQPCLTELTPGRSVWVHGPVRPVHASARWVLAQLLRIAIAEGRRLDVVCGERVRTWWRPTSQAGAIRMEVSATWCDAAFEVWRSGLGPAARLDQPMAGSGADSPATAPVVVRVLSEPPTGAPTSGTDVIDLTEGRKRRFDRSHTLGGLRPTGISEATLVAWLGELADDVHAQELLPGDATVPPLRLPDVVGSRSAVDVVTTDLTGAAAGRHAVSIDLVADGPHLLIAGTTGSGKSELLLSLLIGLAAHHAPAEVAFILLDFKGGASFGPLADLPHTMSCETNHVPGPSLRTLDAVTAELRRREARFAQAGVPDYATFRRRRPEEAMPRLVVAIDELRVLVDEHTEAAAVLQRLAATGRSLGFHLVLATQRPSGSVGSDVRSNIGTVLALRTATEQESWDLIGSTDAALIDAAAPGTAYAARGGRRPELFRSSSWTAGDAAPVWSAVDHTDAWPASADHRPTDWPALVEALRSAYAEGDHLVPTPVVGPALPARFAPDRVRRRDIETLALLDDSAHARHVPWRWRSGPAGRTAWVIEAGGGRSEALAAVLDSAARTGPLLVLDGTGECAGFMPDAHGGGRADVTRLVPAEGADAEGGAAPGPVGGLGEQVLARVVQSADAGGTVVVTGWSAWASLKVGDTYRTLEEELHRWLGTSAASALRLGVVGGRELVTSRLMLHLPHRFYVPAGTSAEHRLVWPRLAPVEPLPGRAVHVSPRHPEPGLPAQLAVPRP